MLNIVLFNPSLLLDAIQTSFFWFFLPFVTFDYLYYLEAIDNGNEDVDNYINSNKTNLHTLTELLILNIVIIYIINLTEI